MDSKAQIKFKQENINKGGLLKGKKYICKMEQNPTSLYKSSNSSCKSWFVEMKKGYASERVSKRQVIVSCHKLTHLQ